MKRLLLLLGLLVSGQAAAQNFEVGRDGWQLERLSNEFVLLRANIAPADEGRPNRRQGLLILTCERDVRRIRFQIGGASRRPSARAVIQGRAIVRGAVRDPSSQAAALYPRVRFFDDGSFEFHEAAAFGDSVMRGFLGLLQQMPARLEVVLFKGLETRAFVRGTAMQFTLHQLDESLGNIYGFEGLCFRS
jgi:hypothetical protein